MPKIIREEDYFAATTMTFGEHLEDLRKVLVRAVLGLVIGFLLGLYVAPYVVNFVEAPLKRALAKYYVARNIEEMRKVWGEALSKDVEKQIAQRGMMAIYYYIEKPEWQRLIEETTGKASTPEEVKPTKNSTVHNTSQTTRSLKKQSPPTIEDPLKEHRENAAEMTRPNPKAEMLLVRMWTPVRAEIKALNAQEAFLIWMKAAFLVGAVLASPYMFYEIWKFVAAGLYPHEQKYVHVYIPFSIGLFLAGVSLAFFFVFDPVLDFLFTFNASMKIDPDPRISEWIGFVLVLPLGFGIAFQLPLVMLFLNRLGLFSIRAYTDKWRISVLAIFVISMVLTPADPVSMLLMALPLTLLYFLGIGLCLWMPKIENTVVVES